MEPIQISFLAYARAFIIDRKFMLDGLRLLSRVIDLPTSTCDRIVFQNILTPSTHAIEQDCRDLVYLKVWDQPGRTEFDQERQTLSTQTTTKVYSGQTVNFQTRERNRQGYVLDLGPSSMDICINHRIESQYHRDALEVALIAYNFLIFGFNQINRSPYANNWYNNVDPNVVVEDIVPENYTCYSGWSTWRYSLLVGTAPPQRLFADPRYQTLLQREAVPVINFTDFPPQAWGGLHRFLLSLGTSALPIFIDHYPGSVCDRMNDWSPSVTNHEIDHADDQLRGAFQHHHASLAIMLGHRPTRLAAEGSANVYWSQLGGKLTATQTPNGKVILLLWIPHPSSSQRMYRNPTTFERIFALVSITVNVIERLLYSMGIDGVDGTNYGLSPSQAESVIAWYNLSPVGRKLMNLVDRLREEWNDQRDHLDPTIPDTLEPLLDKVQAESYLSLSQRDMVVLQDEIETDLTSTSSTPVSTHASTSTSTSTSTSVSGSTKTLFMDKRFDSKIRRRCRERDPTFDYRDKAFQAQMILEECSTVTDELWRALLNANVQNGKFLPWEGESTSAQMERCRAEHYERRVNTPSSDNSTENTCTRCSRVLHKTLQANGRKLVLVNGCRCEFQKASRKKKLSLGWQFVQGAHPGCFPESNIFVLLQRRLPEASTVINAKQLMVLLATTIRTAPGNAHAITLERLFGSCFDGVLEYAVQRDSVAAKAQSAIVLALKRAFDDIPTGQHGVKVASRGPRDFEVAAYKKSGLPKIDLYGFGECSTWPTERMIEGENLAFLDYQQSVETLASQRRTLRR